MDNVDQRSNSTDNNEIMDSANQISDCTDNNGQRKSEFRRHRQ